MPAVLVHGVPDTSLLWGSVLPHLGRDDVITPSLPGFGCPLPAGFDATKESYVRWLGDELERVEQPVDLVGHDWGAIFVQRLVSLRPDLVRTWAAASATISPQGAWHGVARTWQTPGEGEAFMEMMAQMAPAEAAELVSAVGVPADHAPAQVEAMDDIMRDAILKLYRSAVDVFREWSGELGSVTRPGLLLAGADDTLMRTDIAGSEADRLGVPLKVFQGCGHWFPIERPAEFAQALRDHWESV